MSTISVSVLKDRVAALRTRIAEDTARADALEAFVSQPGAEQVLAVLGEAAIPAEASVAPAATKAGKKSGRPKGSKSEKSEKSETSTRTRGGQPSLKSVIVDVLAGKSQGLTLKEIVSEVLNKGYKSNAENFTTVVYQNLYSLLKKENKVENRDHRYILKAA